MVIFEGILYSSMYIFLAIHVSKENNASIHHLPAIFAPTCLLFQKLQKHAGEQYLSDMYENVP